MISRDKARELAIEKIRSNWSVRDDEPSIADSATKEEKFGWVFFYNSKRYHQTQNIAFSLAGNGPVVVDKKTGGVSMLGTSGGVAHQLSEYEKNTEPNKAPEPMTMSVTFHAVAWPAPAMVMAHL